MLFDLDFPCTFPSLGISATFRQQPEDFFVDEQLGFALSGQGEHLCLHIEKIGQNTIFVAKQLAEWAGIKQMDVGYCGLKDRHAVTRQWFSLYLGKRALDISSLKIEGCTVLAVSQHECKLRPGMHAGNAFAIRLRDVQGSMDALEQRWHAVVAQGVPNYFGEQRFGKQGSNLLQAETMLDIHAKQWRERKHQFVVSALRAWLFNRVLADRVAADDWRQCVDGDPDAIPTAPLWGRGRNKSHGALAVREQHLLEPYAQYCEKLEHVGLQQERRALVLPIAAARFQREEKEAVLTFALPVGTYATAVLRECVQLENAQENRDRNPVI
jgi:tRNA pseudouridine13 synthase